MTGGNMRAWQRLYSISKQPNWRLTSWPHTALAREGQVAHKDAVVLRHWDTGSDFFDYWAVCMESKLAHNLWKSFVSLTDITSCKTAVIWTKMTQTREKIWPVNARWCIQLFLWRGSQDCNGWWSLNFSFCLSNTLDHNQNCKTNDSPQPLNGVTYRC